MCTYMFTGRHSTGGALVGARALLDRSASPGNGRLGSQILADGVLSPVSGGGQRRPPFSKWKSWITGSEAALNCQKKQKQN